jgi:hypothetical protein
VRSGKTERTLKILRMLVNDGRGSVAVLDLAPEETGGVGGKIPLTSQEKEKIRYLSPRVIPPRICAKDDAAMRKIARENYRRIQKIWDRLENPLPQILCVNDVSLYLHGGSAEELLCRLGNIPTVLMNGYYGNYFADNYLTCREREHMKNLIWRCDQVLYLPRIPRMEK